MELDVKNLSSDELYDILVDWVAPRPIAWVSTLSKEGVINLAPFSFFNVVCDQPPVLMLSISKKKMEAERTQPAISLIVESLWSISLNITF